MKSLDMVAVLLLFLVVKNVLTDCPESECECGQACVDNSKKWCKKYDDPKCSCNKECRNSSATLGESTYTPPPPTTTTIRCLIFDQLLTPGETRKVYCNICFCSEDSGKGDAACTRAAWCLPDGFTPGVDYPKWYPNNPNCSKRSTHSKIPDPKDSTTDIEKYSSSTSGDIELLVSNVRRIPFMPKRKPDW